MRSIKQGNTVDSTTKKQRINRKRYMRILWGEFKQTHSYTASKRSGV